MDNFNSLFLSVHGILGSEHPSHFRKVDGPHASVISVLYVRGESSISFVTMEV